MSLLTELAHIDWQTIFRTYGNSHSTLIGLLVQWWIASGQNRWVLEGAPQIGLLPDGTLNRSACDAVFGENLFVQGLLEVEGTRYDETIRKIAKYFQSVDPIYKRLTFAIMLAYPTKPQGRGKKKSVPSVPIDSLNKVAQKICDTTRAQEILLLGIEKQWMPQYKGPLVQSDYYQCIPTEVWALSIQANDISPKTVLARGDSYIPA